MDSKESALVNSTLDTLGRTSFYHSSTIDTALLDLMEKKLLKWPKEMRFVCLDILRAVAVHPAGTVLLAKWPLLAKVISDNVTQDQPRTSVAIVFRLVANLFHSPDAVAEEMHKVVSAMLSAATDAGVLSCDHMLSRVALASVLVKYVTVLFVSFRF